VLARLWSHWELSCCANGNAKWCNRSGKTIWLFVMKINIHLAYDPEIPLLGIYHRGMTTYIYTKTCAWCLLQLYSELPHTRNGPNVPLVVNGLNKNKNKNKKPWHNHTKENYLAVKGNELLINVILSKCQRYCTEWKKLVSKG